MQPHSKVSLEMRDDSSEGEEEDIVDVLTQAVGSSLSTAVSRQGLQVAAQRVLILEMLDGS